MNHPNARVFVSQIGVLLSLLLLMKPSPIHAHPGPPILEKAKTCQENLLRSNQAMRYRHRWEKCISLYEKFIKSHAQHPSKEEALFQLAELYLGLSKFSGKVEYINSAERLAGELKINYPASQFLKVIAARLAKARRNIPYRALPPIQARLKDVRSWSYPGYTRVVFDLSGQVTYSQQTLSDPERLVIDFENARLEKDLDQKVVTIQDSKLTEIKAVQETPTTVRAILELRQAADFHLIHFSDPERIVVDVFGRKPDQSTPLPRQPSFVEIRRILIDPGHGGKDPGAIGRSGLTEKKVVLDVSLRLRELIKQNLGSEVLMTRERDVYIPLEERTQIANGKRADLFISIHANAARNPKIRGVEIYTLGQATDSSALATAARENSIREGSLKNLEGVIKLMLADLSIMKRLDYSLEFADTTRLAFLKTLGASHGVIDLGVKQAPFYVLMNAGMPSILAEISFISNPVEEKRLASPAYRQRIAQSLFEGIQNYLLKNGRELKAQN